MMTNYVLIPHFANEEEADYFHRELQARFPRNLEDQADGIKYFGFVDRERAGVEDQIREVLHNISIGTEDYVALYYTKDDSPGNIMQAMILGHDEKIESVLQRINPEEHVNTLSRLLNHDYLKATPRR